MISFTFILSFVGFYLWYATSKKMKAHNIFGIEEWSAQKQGVSKLLGSLCLFAASGVAINHFGIGAGLFTFFIVLMTISSLVILLIPLGVLNKTVFLIASLLSLITEMLV